jgi:protein-S-isoprenylcysteine O-methyltransferase Ste14
MITKEISAWFARYRILFSKIITIILLVIFLFSEPKWGHLSFAEGLATLLQAIGLVLITICAFGRLWAALYLCGNKTHTLITQGPYSIVRNPLYFFSFLGVVGIGITAGSVTGLILIIAMFALYYLPTIIDEEKTLEQFHKDELKAYMERVPRFIPNFALLSEPASTLFEPYGFRKTVFDVMWFIWVYILLEIIETLHFFHILPVIFKIV